MRGMRLSLVGGLVLAVSACTIIKESDQPQQPPQPAQGEPSPAQPTAVQGRAVATAPPAAPAPVVVAATEQAPSPATQNCKVIVVTATRGSETLGELRFQDECDKAPGYDCKDSGEGCAETLHQIDGTESWGGQTFVWVTTSESWHDGDFSVTELYGYGCGALKKVFSYNSNDNGITVSAELKMTADDWRQLTASISHDGGSATDTLVWDAASCTYKSK